MKNLFKTRTTLFIASIAISVIGFQACKKETLPKNTENESKNVSINPNSSIPLNSNGKIINPYSLKNIREARAAFGVSKIRPIDEEESSIMIRIETGSIDEYSMPYLEDSAIKLFNYPLNAPEVYQNGFNETVACSLKNNMYLYTTVPIHHPLLNTISYTILDSLYHPNDNEDTLKMALLIQAGYYTLMGDSATEVAWSWPRPVQPEGNITYSDEQLGSVASKGVNVWAIDFGFMVSSNADMNGHYKINTGFWVGTTLGLHYKNWRMNVKPLNWTSSNIAANIANVTANFIGGSIYTHGWVWKNSLSNTNMHLGNHTQQRFWAHTMNCVFEHDLYIASENLPIGPQRLVIYDFWNTNTSTSGTPLLGHLSPAKIILNAVMTKFLGLTTNISSTYPNLFNAMFGILPDLCISTKNSTSSYSQYSCELSQLIYHELSHAHFFQKVGGLYWLNVINQELVNECPTTNYYGCGNWKNSQPIQNDNYIQMTEAWAEFLGQNYAYRKYPNGGIKSGAYYGTFQNFSVLREDESYFLDSWICKGLFNDLMDGGNNSVLPNFEPKDKISGRTIKQMYDLFGPNVINVQDYKVAYVNIFGNATDFQDIAVLNGVTP